MKSAIIALAVIGIFSAGHAAANEKIAQSNGGMTCHAIEKKGVGPSYKDVAAKYARDQNAEANLEKKVKAGGSGVWGATPMPPNAHVKEDDIKSIVHWVLTLK